MSAGYRMPSGEAEQLYLRHLFANAMEQRSPVRVSFFEQKKLPNGKRIPGLYVKVTRVVEPHGFHVARDGKRSVLVVDRTPNGVGSRPAYRAIRLDRIAYSRAQRRFLIRRMLTYGYLYPSLLDRKPLHPTKGELVHR